MSEYYQQGIDKALAKDYAGAIEAFELALISNPNWAEVHYRRGLVYFDLGDHVAAVGDYTRSIDLQPQQKDAYYGRALVRLLLKNFTGALTDVDKAIQFGRDHAPSYQLKGTICQKLAQRQDAIQAFKLAASLYLKQQDLANSRACLAKAEELSPYKNNTNVPQGISYASAIAKAEAGDLWAASQEADTLVRVNSQDAKAYCCRGLIHQMRDNLPAALLDFNTAIRLDPAVHTAYRHRGRMRYKMGDLQGAIDDFTQALAINPYDGEIQVFLSQIYLAKGDNVQAVAALDKAVQLTPTPDVYMERAQFYAKTEELTAAQADYQTAANLYFEQHDLANYQIALDKLKNLQQLRPANTAPSHVEPPSSGNKELRQRLLKMVGGQWPIAEAIIQRYRTEYPGYDDDWYLEQAIAYIEQA